MVQSVATFERDVLQRSHQVPVLVDFWAEWCGPCRVLGPVLERVTAAAAGKLELVKVNVDEAPDIAAPYRVSSIPAVKLFYEGTVVAEFVGALPEREVLRWLDQHLPTEGKRLLAEAKTALAAGEQQVAREKLRAAIEAEPTNSAARLALAELVVREAPAQALGLLEALPANDVLADRAEVVQTLAALVGTAAADAPPPTGTKPQSWQDYLDGARAFAKGDDAGALERWIDLVRKDRQLDEDGAKRACIALFTLLGEDSDTTQEYRRSFSSALY